MRSQEMVVERACQSMRLRARGRGRGLVRLDDLAREVGWTKSHFCRAFKKVKGVTMGEWVKVERKGGRSTEVEVDGETADTFAVAVISAEVEDREDWDMWLNYFACSTPVLTPLAFPYFD